MDNQRPRRLGADGVSLYCLVAGHLKASRYPADWYCRSCGCCIALGA
jgi:hypothetical protein